MKVQCINCNNLGTMDGEIFTCLHLKINVDITDEHNCIHWEKDEL